MTPRAAAIALCVLASPLVAPAALAAESYDNCAGTVASLPAVIGTQGVWCLKKDLATNSASGNAITVSAPNVTLDCNGFKLGGLSAGVGTAAVGINASGYSNLTVRNCNIRGFETGVLVDNTSGGGHLIEDNRFEGNTRFGMRIYGDGSLVRGNLVYDTGGSTLPINVRVAGIQVEGNIDVIDNAVRVVDGTSQSMAFVYGIINQYGDAGTIARNRVSGLVHNGAVTYDIRAFNAPGLAIRDNDVNGSGEGVTCTSARSVAVGNILNGHFEAISECTDGGNTIIP